MLRLESWKQFDFLAEQSVIFIAYYVRYNKTTIKTRSYMYIN